MNYLFDKREIGLSLSGRQRNVTIEKFFCTVSAIAFRQPDSSSQRRAPYRGIPLAIH